MLEAARRIRQYTANLTLDQYVEQDLVQSAVERQLEILGEAARRVSEAFKGAHSQIPWTPIIAQRNVLAHEYGEIIPVQIWKVVVTYIPALIGQLEPLIPPLPPEKP